MRQCPKPGTESVCALARKGAHFFFLTLLEDERDEDDLVRDEAEEDLDLELELILFEVVPREELPEERILMDLLLLVRFL